MKAWLVNIVMCRVFLSFFTYFYVKRYFTKKIGMFATLYVCMPLCLKTQYAFYGTDCVTSYIFTCVHVHKNNCRW